MPASGRARDFSRAQTPCTFRLRRPPDPQHPLTSPVARAADGELPPLPSGPTAPPKSHRETAVLARTIPPACPLRLTRLTTRNVFDWLDPDLSAGSGCSITQLALGLRTTGTPFCNLKLPARHGDGSPHFATSRRTGTARRRYLPTRRRHLLPISAANLLSTSTRRILPFPIARLAPSRPTLPPLPLGSHACATFGPAPSTTAPDSRKRHLRPQVVAHLMLCSPAVTMIHRCP